MVSEVYPMSGLQVTFQIENKWFHIIKLCPQANQLNVGYLRDLFQAGYFL